MPKRNTSRAYRALREDILDRQPLCIDCLDEGRTVAAEELDHIVPLHLGGDSSEANLAPRCKEHHWRKSLREKNARRGRLGHLQDGTPRARL